MAVYDGGQRSPGRDPPDFGCEHARGIDTDRIDGDYAVVRGDKHSVVPDPPELVHAVGDLRGLEVDLGVQRGARQHGREADGEGESWSSCDVLTDTPHDTLHCAPHRAIG